MSKGGLEIAIDATNVPGDLEDFAALVDEVDKKKPSQRDLQRQWNLLETAPGLWRSFSDLSNLAAETMISGLRMSRSMEEALRVGVGKMKQELGYDHSPALERLLIEQVLLCWLRLNILEAKLGELILVKHSIREGEYWDKRLSAAQRRYTWACETLARVRKLVRQTPIVQVNIAAAGGQQVNVQGQG